ncbi:hypothetical protein K461DRAFT_295619 [Myriangium duriaei CBS 260.36]|uniref:Uncharacterized protein n=1 Tax=Myriangium duriaei CBS 260.36 TaxID=1168546 RepID=A0A9P4MDS9_9PEZI|nr:hypothetical protein K461DRAFT_295619 [Myriangium duriaei CBS 260.36]
MSASTKPPGLLFTLLVQWFVEFTAREMAVRSCAEQVLQAATDMERGLGPADYWLSSSSSTGVSTSQFGQQHRSPL